MSPESSARPGRSLLELAIALLVVALASLIAYAGYFPPALSSHGVDKIIHAGMGFTLTALLARVLRYRALLAAAIVFVPVALDEYLQRYSPARNSDWGDLLADVVGIGLATWMMSRRADG